jgi:hypothetical protein
MFMAHQYITVENQTLLWKTINRSPQFANNTIAIHKEQWFSNIIKQFYENIKSPTLSMADLKALNQQTIAYMVSDLKRILSYEDKTNPRSGVLAESQYSPSAIDTSYVNRPALNSETPQTRMSMYNDQFNARQQEYTNMTKPPAPPIANFTEKLEEEPITNMDELLQQQIKQREYDVAQARPPPPLTTLPPTLPNQTVKPLSSPMSPNRNNIATTNLEAMNAIIQDLAKQLAELREEIAKITKRTDQETHDIKQPIIVAIQSGRTDDTEDTI